MTIWTLFLLALGLSMDAFAVAICKGLAMDKVTLQRAAVVGLWFGGFQGLMPCWLAAGLSLCRLHHRRGPLDRLCPAGPAGHQHDPGGPMSRRGRHQRLPAFRVMLPMAVATSIDALAVGITFAFLEVSILPAVCFIAATTFLLSCIGVKVGNLCGTRFQSKAELLGASSLSFWASNPAGAPGVL